MISVRVDTRQLENKLHVLARVARVTPGQVIKEEVKLATQQIIRLTPPNNLAQGRKAVASDMRNVVTSLPSDSDRPAFKVLNRVVKSGNVAAIQKILNGWKTKPKLATNGAQIKAEHLNKRTRYGRVHARANLMALARDANRYLREVQSRVGWAKGSWVRTLIAAGGSAPSWIARHASAAGSVIANFGENPRVIAIAHNVKIPGYQRTVDAAIRTRERIAQRKIDRIVAGKATNLGFTVIEGS
jgi:hypothetical protein